MTGRCKHLPVFFFVPLALFSNPKPPREDSRTTMPFDPNIPAHNAELTSALFRGQFNGLKDLIDAIQQGGITNVIVDAVNPLPPGSNANVAASLNETELHLTFDLPQGNDGAEGRPGEGGSQGPPFAQAVVDGVTTLAPGQPASVDVTFDGSNVRLTFGIPRGQDGSNGIDGQPGEVSQTDLTNAILGALDQSSANTNGVSTLDTAMADPDAEMLRQKINEMLNALRR